MSSESAQSVASWMGFALTAALLLIGLCRLAQVAFHAPLLGYANNYDFIKLSSTVGIWVDEPGVDPSAQHPSAPYSHYRSHGERIKDLRYLSSELVLVYPAIIAANVLNWLRRAPPNTFDLRTIGAVKTIFFLAAGIFLTVLFFRRSPWLGIASASSLALVICDPFNTLYFNTLYFDDSAVLFTYLAVGLALFLVLTKNQSVTLMGLFCIALLLAGLSKMQHPGLPLAIVLAYGVGQARRCWPSYRAVLKAFLPPVAAALLALGLGVANNRSSSMQGMVAAAATDSWFATVLPALENPKAVLRSLGVPERCDAGIGKSAFDYSGCPEVLHLNRFQMVWILLKEPAALWQIVKRAVPATRPFIVFYGQVEGRSFGHIEDEGLRFSSLGQVVDELKAPIYVVLFSISVLGGALSLALLLGGHVTPAPTFCALLNAVVASSFIASLLGDGYIDLARHFHLGQNALLLSPVPAIVAAGGLLVRLSRRMTFFRSDQLSGNV